MAASLAGRADAARVEGALARSMFGSGLRPEDRVRVAALAVVRRLKRGQALFTEGEAAAGLFLVVEGTIKVFKLAPDGREKVLHAFGPGETIAEAALFGDGRYPAHAEALGTASVACLPRGPLLQLLREEPEICLRLLASLSAKLKLLGHRIETLAFQSAACRLACYLVHQREGGAEGVVRLSLPKKDLASFLGVTPETLSRLLATLRERGLIAAQGRTVRVLDAMALRRLAEGESSAHDAA